MRRPAIGTHTLSAVIVAMLLGACGHSGASGGSDPLADYIHGLSDCKTLAEVELEVDVVFNPQLWPKGMLDPTQHPHGHKVPHWPDIWDQLHSDMNQSPMTHDQMFQALIQRGNELGCPSKATI